MRFRNLFMIGSTLVFGASLLLYGWFTYQQAFFTSNDINRDDARRESTTLLSKDDWAEFQLVPGANKIRLLTNAALKTVDAPDYDLSNPRLGWRYAIEYEILDANRNLIRKSDYHFRSQVRQLVDMDQDKAIYPLFFGKTSLISSQTRTMQIANDRLERRVAIVRVRLLSADQQIQEVVARLYARTQRKAYNNRKTWNRLSERRRENITRYCVYGQELLTEKERNSLMRWRWSRCPTLGQFDKRYLFFIGDVDDQEVRDEQIPLGLYTDTSTLATIPVPEGMARLDLEFTPLDINGESQFVDVSWFGLNPGDRSHIQRRLSDETVIVELPVDGGLVQIESSTRLVTRAFWSPIDELAKQFASQWEENSHHLMNQVSDDFEITPRPAMQRTFLVDQEPLEYAISHYQNQSTPLRVQLRYPMSAIFGNSAGEQQQHDELSAADVTGDQCLDYSTVFAHWEFVDRDGTIVDSGDLTFCPKISHYDWLTTNGIRETVSDPVNFYFSVPDQVEKFRVQTNQDRLLLNSYVRPKNLPRTICVPEDYNAFNRLQSLNRSWFGINPTNHLAMIRDNRSFLVGTQIRPPEIDDEILSGNYEWIRFDPQNTWVGRQILVPHTTEKELNIREQSAAATFFELQANKTFRFREAPSKFGRATVRSTLIYAADQPPGTISIQVNGREVKQFRSLTKRGEIDLSGLALPESGQIKIQANTATRFFLRGLDIPLANRYLKRTVQRFTDDELNFTYEKKTDSDELLTLRLYRRNVDAAERCQLQVKIGLPESAQRRIEKPQMAWTVTDRIYDLRKLNESPSLLLGKNGCLDTGHRCFVKLGAELPPGEYSVNIRQLDKTTDGFLLLYQTVAGTLPIRKLQLNRPVVFRP